MHIEHDIMKNIMRITSNSRRRPRELPKSEMRKCRGFGHILDLLLKHNGMTQRQIAEALDIRPQSVSEALTNMESRGLIRRQTNPQDRRSSLIYVTDEGAQRQTEMLNERILNAKRIFSALDENEKDTLLALLEKVTSSLQENKEER